MAVVSASFCRGENWPMWRRDAGRTGVTTESLSDDLSLVWMRELPPVEPAFHSERLQFDAGYEPVIADRRLLISSSRNDSVTAYEATTGEELWVFPTNGPVRFAPAVWKESVCFGSDDGYLYCVSLKTGGLRWKVQAAPSNRRVIGNKRLISVWPVRGGPVVSEGRVYFAAGVWPFEGVFVYAIDIASGEVIWRNERLGTMFGQQPHNTQAIGGLAPQGYLVVNGEELVVPCSTAYPARLNRETGELIEFQLPSPGRLPGGWFAALDPATAKAVRRGEIKYDDLINRQRHEDNVRKGVGETGVSRKIQVADRSLNFDDEIANVSGKIHSLAVADNRLFVSTRKGALYCFEETDGSSPKESTRWKPPASSLKASQTSLEYAELLTREANGKHGLAFVFGLRDGDLVKALLLRSNYHVVAFHNDLKVVAQMRNELKAAGVYGQRAAVFNGDPKAVSPPPYVANLITTETPGEVSWKDVLVSLRPFGGLAALREPKNTAAITADQLALIEPDNFELAELNDEAIVRREGPLPGAARYEGGYALAEDELVRFPLGVLWFDDTLQHFKRSPQPEFYDGVMVSRPKDWTAPRIKGNHSVDYPLLEVVLSDIYTGRVLEESEKSSLRKLLPKSDGKPKQSYYHAPHQKTALGPPPPVVGERVNPLTLKKEPRDIAKTYGCDGGVDYGPLYTLRAGTAAYYDKTLESGTVFLSGPRSGCTNSIIPSGGVLNVPYFYEGCTCSYPLPCAMSLVAMPESHEQWSCWGDGAIKPDSIVRIGLNFGAPGDRMTRDGTLWLDYPSIGGPSPKVHVESEGDAAFHYRHSMFTADGDGWSWVAASAAEGMTSLTLHDLKSGDYTVRLYFAEREGGEPDRRLQSIALQGKTLLQDFDIVAEAKQPMKAVVKEFTNISVDDSLTLSLTATKGDTLVSGIELIPVD